jgi:Mg2+ and Co2+ transporter CorA
MTGETAVSWEEIPHVAADYAVADDLHQRIDMNGYSGDHAARRTEFPQWGMGEVALKFTAAARRQLGAAQDIAERLDRLENESDAQVLRAAMADLCDALARFTSQTERNTDRTQGRLAELSDTGDGLGREIAAVREDVEKIRAVVRDQQAAIAALSQSTNARVTEIEKSIADLRARDTQQTEDRGKLATRIAGMEAGIENNRAREQALADLHSRLADTLSPAPPR